jgi:diacylglycerol kinase (ATP)
MLNGIHEALLIYNPASGGARHRRLSEVIEAARILAQAGVLAEMAPTSARGSATRIARRAAEEGRQLVIACGGDGTVNEVVNGLAGSKIPLAVLPAGTANVLAKELRIPWDIPRAAKLIPEGVAHRIALGAVGAPDSGRDSWRYFLCLGGAGPDGAMVHALENSARKKNGTLDYWLEGIVQLFVYHFPEFRVVSEGRERRATLIVVGRTKSYGGPFRITTGASLLEDNFEIVTYTTRNRFRYLLCLPALWLNRLRSMRGIEFWKAKEVRCEPLNGEPVFAQVDGEPIGRLPLEFHVVPDALTLVIPSGVKLDRT